MENLIISGVRLKNGSVVIELPRGHYLVDGVAFNVESYNSKDTLTVDKVPTIQRVEDKNVIYAYQNVETLEQITFDQYFDMQKTILEKRIMIGQNEYDCDEYSWKNIDDRLEYEKFKLIWRALSKTFTDVISEYEVTIIDRIYSDNEYIIPTHHLGKPITENLFSYQASVVSMTHDIAKKHGYVFTGKNEEMTPFTYSIPTHSGIRYLQISNKYVCNDNMKFNPMTGTYEECLNAYKKHYEMIENLFLEDKNKNIILTALKAKEILDEVRSIRSQFNKIDYKTKTASNYRLTSNYLDNLVKKLEAYIVTPEATK